MINPVTVDALSAALRAERAVERVLRKAANRKRYERQYARHAPTPPGRKRRELRYNIRGAFTEKRDRASPRVVQPPAHLGGANALALLPYVASLIARAMAKAGRKNKFDPHQGKAEMERRAQRLASGRGV